MKFVVYKWVSNSDTQRRENDFETQEWEIQSYLDTHALEDYQVIDGFTDFHDIYRPKLKKAVLRALSSGATLLVARPDCLNMKDSFLVREISAGNLMVKIAQRPNVVLRPRPAARAAMPLGQDAPHPAPPDAYADGVDQPKGGTSLPPRSSGQSTAETAPNGTGVPDIWALLDVYRRKSSSTLASQSTMPSAAYETESGHRPCLKTGNSNMVQLKPEGTAIDLVPPRTDAVQFSIGHWMDRAVIVATRS